MHGRLWLSLLHRLLLCLGNWRLFLLHSLHSLLLQVLVAVDLDRHFVFQEVVYQHFCDAFHMVLTLVLEVWGLVPTSAHLSRILLLVHVKLILAVNVAAKVFWQVADVRYLDLEVKSLVQVVHRII